MNEITIFTPTYNRSHILQQCYSSLCQQTNQNFIWLIVDDGSTDQTRKVVEQFIEEGKVVIQYIFQENHGKQRATNTAIHNCKTKYFAFLDSDDYYLPTTVEKFHTILKKIEKNGRVAGILARRGDSNGKIIGTPFLPELEFISNVDVLVRKYNFSGDTCRVYKTEVIRNYLYPEIEDKFILECVMLSKIDYYYDMYILNEVCSISEYLEDGYTRNSFLTYERSPYGFALGMNQMIISRRGLVNRIRYVLVYTTWCWSKGIKQSFKKCKSKVLYAIILPISVFLYVLRIPKWIYSK